MKKILVGLILLLLIAVSSVYIFIPGEIKVSAVVYTTAKSKWVYHYLQTAEQRKKWLAGADSLDTDNAFSYNGMSFEMKRVNYNGIDINTQSKQSSIPGTLSITPSGPDTVVLAWATTVPAGSLPWQRVQQYQKATKIKTGISRILEQLHHYLSNNKNIYGIAMQMEQVKDTVLISNLTYPNRLPDVAMIYQQIDSLKKYIVDNNGTETGSPMLNIQTIDEHRFRLQVAIPINHSIPETSSFTIKRMIPGKILTTVVKGNNSHVEEAIRTMETFIEDYQQVSPAIPFQSLITNRKTQPDSSLWETKIYYPIF